MADLEARLLSHLGTGDAAHDPAHAQRVWRLARQIAEGEQINPDRVLMAASLLHDLVTLPKNHPDRARGSAMSAKAARPILASEGFGAAEIEGVAHAIEAHSFSARITPTSDTARILQDADRIEALGAVGLARVFSVSGELGRPLWSPDDPFALNRQPDDTLWALDHFKTKLLSLPERMNTATGQAIARQRAAVLVRFLADLASELGAD